VSTSTFLRYELVTGTFSPTFPIAQIAPALPGDPFVCVILAIRNKAGFIWAHADCYSRPGFSARAHGSVDCRWPIEGFDAGCDQSIAAQYSASAITILDNPVWSPITCEPAWKTLVCTSADNVGGRMDPVGQNAIGKAVALGRPLRRSGWAERAFTTRQKRNWWTQSTWARLAWRNPSDGWRLR
jgi:hypothetical protein